MITLQNTVDLRTLLGKVKKMETLLSVDVSSFEDNSKLKNKIEEERARRGFFLSYAVSNKYVSVHCLFHVREQEHVSSIGILTCEIV